MEAVDAAGSDEEEELSPEFEPLDEEDFTAMMELENNQENKNEAMKNFMTSIFWFAPFKLNQEKYMLALNEDL